MRIELKAINRKPIEELHVRKDGKLAELLEKRRLTVMYHDGSEKSYGVKWKESDLAALDMAKPGVFEIEGTAVLPDYGDVLVEQRADPYVLLAEDGYYYFTASYPVCGCGEDRQGIGYDRIVLRRAKTIAGLKEAKEVTLWHQKTSRRVHRYIWAPELYQIGGQYYILFTASVEEDNVWGIRPHMLKCMGDDLMNPENWNTPDESNLYRLTGRAGDVMPFADFSLDMTYFENRGRHYLAWAQKADDRSDIYLAEIAPEEPWKLISPCVLLTRPEFPWEMQGNVKVNEGPILLKNAGKLYLAFSASAVDYTYCVGFLEAEEEADLLAEGVWKKYEYPFLTSDDFTDQCGPGHNSFVPDENGNVTLVYHARPFTCSNAQDAAGNYGRCAYVGQGEEALSDPCRHARAKGINFAADGTPVLHMTPEQELPEQYRKVKIKIVVEGED